MTILQIDVPRIGSHIERINKKIKLSNATILAILEKLDSEPPKSIHEDFDVCISTVYKLNRDYIARDGILYRRVKNEY